MHWLQPIDDALFFFCNRTLANPFFDWLMPLLSGSGVPWLPLLLVVAPLIFYFGRARLRLCVLFMVLVVAIGGALNIDPIKDSLSRPRPFVVLKEARLYGTVGKGYVAPLANGELPAATPSAFFDPFKR